MEGVIVGRGEIGERRGGVHVGEGDERAKRVCVREKSRCRRRRWRNKGREEGGRYEGRGRN